MDCTPCNPVAHTHTHTHTHNICTRMQGAQAPPPLAVGMFDAAAAQRGLASVPPYSTQ